MFITSVTLLDINIHHLENSINYTSASTLPALTVFLNDKPYLVAGGPLTGLVHFHVLC